MVGPEADVAVAVVVGAAACVVAEVAVRAGNDAADLFVAFAGIADRPVVTAAADVVVRAYSLSPIVALALGDDDASDPQIRTLLTRGRTLLQLPVSLTSAMRDQTPR